jgi:hypothetical protein
MQLDSGHFTQEGSSMTDRCEEIRRYKRVVVQIANDLFDEIVEEAVNSERGEEDAFDEGLGDGAALLSAAQDRHGTSIRDPKIVAYALLIAIEDKLFESETGIDPNGPARSTA